MLLEHLSICNYGVYAGKNDFDLTSTPKKPIVLVGGHNGAGKTTILESMMVALYGKVYFGIKKTKKEYLDFIYEKIHRSDKKRADYASVEIRFRFYHNGSEDKYMINRNWNVNGASVTESFSVQKNDCMMDDVDESQWQTFIEGLLPLGIAKLFFFDGEKIVKITENKGQYNNEIKTSLDTLIGADLINRLHADLNLYVLRKSGKKNTGILQQYKELEQEKNQLSSDIESLNIEQEKKLAGIENVTAKINLKESTISGIGGGYVDIRGNLMTEKAVLEEKIRILTKQIQEELSEDAPLYLVCSMLNRINKQIQKDAKMLSGLIPVLDSKVLLPKIEKRLSDSAFWPQGTDSKASTLHVMNILNDFSQSQKDKTFFDLSPNDTMSLTEITHKVNKKPITIINATDSFVKLVDKIEKIESNITRIPKDDELGPRISEINEMHQDIGLLKGELEHIDQQLASKRSYKKILQGKLKTILTLIYQDKTASTGVNLASKMQNVLDTYHSNLKERKIKDLESNLLYTVKMLLHKKSIQKIAIDRDTFEIKVFENDQDQISGDFLSMGERQIVGTALLWAIARTCGRSLPFVIDTPLGRLDGLHLVNLVEKFYPFASHQTILLSTDREIGPNEYHKISKSISRSYKITCDENKSVTTVKPGYFMEEEIASVR